LTGNPRATARTYVTAAIAVVVLIAIAIALWKTMQPQNQQTFTTTTTPASTTEAPAAPKVLVSLKASVYSGPLPMGTSTLVSNYSYIYFGQPPDKAEVVIYLFYDAFCPYCAREVVESAEYLGSLAASGNVSLVLVDTLVHDMAADRHGIFRCLAKQGAPVLAIMYEYYKESMDMGQWMKPGSLMHIAEKYNATTDMASCINSEADEVKEMKQWVIGTIGIRGTPTVIIHSSKLGKAYAVPGYVGLENLKKAIEPVLSGQEPTTG